MIDKINGLANKGLKVWFLAVFVMLVLYSLFDNTPGSVSDAKTDLFLGYRDNIYPTAQCSHKKIDASWVILCHPEGKSTGGLFEVVDADDGYILYPLNGKAQSHASKIGLSLSSNRDSKVSVSSALELFKADIEG